MLDSLRKGASGIVAKALMMFLVLTFALWGVGDMLRQHGNGSIASVGSVSISPAEFESRLRNMKRSLGNVPPEYANSPEFKQQVLQGMVQQALLLQEAHKQGVMLDNKAMAKVIAETPQFQKKDGTFDAERFRAFLQGSDLSEGMFLDIMRRDVTSSFQLESLSMPKALGFPVLAKALAMAQEQSRSAEVYVIRAVTPSSIAQPDDKILQSYYTEVKEQYLTPERRTIDYVTVPRESIEKHIRDAITDQDIKDRYAQEKDSLGAPEKRSVTQWLFDNEASAKQAADALAKGEKPQDGKPTEMHDVTREGLPKEAAESVFTLKEKGVTQPVRTAFGWHVFVVDSITPSKVPTLDAVKAKIVDKIAADRADDSLQDISGQLEDAVAGGDSLQKAADDLKLNATTGTLKDVDKQGRNPQGAGLSASQVAAAALTRGYSLDEGENSNFERTADKNYYAVFTRSVSSPAPQSLAEIRQELIKRYIDGQVQMQTAKQAQQMALGLASDKPEALKGVEKRSVSGITLAEAMNTAKEVNGLPGVLMRSIFAAKLGEFTPPARADNGDWMMAKVTQIDASTKEPAADTTLPEKQRAEFANSLYNDYMSYLVKRFPVKINQDLLKDNNSDEQ